MNERLIGLAVAEILGWLDLYFKAKMLDNVIDVLTGYSEAEKMYGFKNRMLRLDRQTRQ